MSLRCKVSGHDRNECGICRRCGDESEATHAWQSADRQEPCFELSICERCNAERKKPDHDWEPFQTPAGESGLRCSRCNLAI